MTEGKGGGLRPPGTRFLAAGPGSRLAVSASPLLCGLRAGVQERQDFREGGVA